MYRSVPDYIQLYCTLRCNLSCSFCFNRGIPSQADVSVCDFERIVSLLSERGIQGLDILGGEPTLHPGLGELVERASARAMRTTLSTNGHDVRLLEHLHRRYDNGVVRVGVSLHSEVIPGELHRYITTCRPMLKSVSTKDRKLTDAAREYLFLPGLTYYLLYADAVSRDDLRSCRPFYEFFHDLVPLKRDHLGLKGVFCSGFIPDVTTYPVLEYVRCPAGTTKLSVLPDGSVYPCYLFFRNQEFRLGNILVSGFDEIWESPKLDFFRRFEGNTCTHRGCELFPLCHGGCPAVSLLICGDLRAPDPRCVRPLF